MAKPELAWTALHFAGPVSPPAVHEFLLAIVGLPGRPVVVFEADARGSRIGSEVQWRIGIPAQRSAELLALVATHWPQVATSRTSKRNLRSGRMSDLLSSLEAAVTLALPGHRQAPLSVDGKAALDAVSRGMLSTLTATSSGERVLVQCILGSVRAPALPPPGAATQPSLVDGLLGRRPPADAARQRLLVAKRSGHRFETVVRIGASATTRRRARYSIARVIGAWQPLASAGVQISSRPSNPQHLDNVRTPWLWPLELAIPEVAAILAWPIADDPDSDLPGLPARHPRRLPLTDAHLSAGRVLGRAVAASGQPRSLGLSPTDSLRHLHVVGPTGVGKSTLLGNLALGDIAAGNSLVVIDPKGDLVRDLLDRIPSHRVDDVVVISANDPSPVGVSLLTPPLDPTAARRWQPDRAADSVSSVIRGLYGDQIGPRSSDILHSSLLTMARANTIPNTPRLSLPLLPVLLSDAAFRRRITAQVAPADPMGIGAFWAWFESISEGERQQAVAPLMNKLRPLLLRPGIRAIFGQTKPRFALDDLFTKPRIVLIDLGKGQLGGEGARLLGSLIMALLWQASLARTTVPASQRHPVQIIVDEMQDYVGWRSDLGDALAQARGLGVGFTLAHQHLGQLPPRLQADVLANAQNRIAFRLGSADAKVMAALTGGTLEAADFSALGVYEAYAGLLHDGSATPWVSVRTTPLPASLGSAARVRETSRQAWGRPIGEVEADMLAISQPARAQSDRPFGVRRTGNPGDVQ